MFSHLADAADGVQLVCARSAEGHSHIFNVGDRIRYNKSSMWSPHFDYGNILAAEVIERTGDNIYDIEIKITDTPNKRMIGSTLQVCSLYFELDSNPS